MSSQVVLLICLLLVVSLSMHACSGRYLLSDLIDDTAEAVRSSKQHYPPKLVEDHGTMVGAIINAIKHNPLSLRALSKEENNNLTEGMRKISGRVLMVEMKKKKMKEKEDNNKSKLGDDDHESKEANYADDDEAAAAEESNSSGNVVVMDYAQPHRKPPIHNEKSSTIN